MASRKKMIDSVKNRSRVNELRELGFGILFISIEVFGSIGYADLVREWAAEPERRELKQEPIPEH